MPNEEKIQQLEYANSKHMLEFDIFKADLSKVLFQITERLASIELTTKASHNDLEKKIWDLEAKISLLDQERLCLEGRIQTLERFTHNLNTLHESHTAEILQNMRDIKTLQDDLTTLEEDTEINNRCVKCKNFIHGQCVLRDYEASKSLIYCKEYKKRARDEG